MKNYRRYASIVFITKVILLLLLLAFEAVWVIFGSPTTIPTQIGLQRARSERIEKDALVLEYRSDPDERSQALSELQDTIALFTQAQQALQSGNAALNMPKHPPAEVITLVNLSNTDYYPITVAAQTILAHHAPVDPLQVQIILAHEHPYAVDINNIALAWETQIDTVFQQLFLIEAGITTAVLGIMIFNYIMMLRHHKSHEGE